MRRVAEKTDGVVRYYHIDHLGSTRLMTDSRGSIVAEYKYYPYGANLAQNIQDPGFDGAIYRVTGKGDSPNIGLYYYGARFCDPEVGRFITVDPARDGLNWYKYCASNPLMYVDPTGKAGIFAIPIVKVFVATAVPVIVKLAVDLAEPVGEVIVDGVSWFRDTVSSWFAADSSNETADGEKTSEGAEKTEAKDPTSPGSMQKKVEKGQAPREVDRVDKPHVPGQKPHVHFKDGISLNNDGTVHDAHKGTPNPSNKTIDWLNDNGWKVK
jgi:RHS repeat-associated protein